MGCSASKSANVVAERPNSAPESESKMIVSNTEEVKETQEPVCKIEPSEEFEQRNDSKSAGGQQDAPPASDSNNNSDPNIAATNIQRVMRGARDRKRVAIMRKSKYASEDERQQKATHIQAGWRGYQDRKRVQQRKKEASEKVEQSQLDDALDDVLSEHAKNQKENDEEAEGSYFAHAAADDDEEEAASQNEDARYFQKQREASVVLQKNWRGYHARKEIQRRRKNRDDESGAKQE